MKAILKELQSLINQRNQLSEKIREVNSSLKDYCPVREGQVAIAGDTAWPRKYRGKKVLIKAITPRFIDSYYNDWKIFAVPFLKDGTIGVLHIEWKIRYE